MLILHNKQILKQEGSIIIPPFQAGHLGFIPGRSVHVYLLRQHETPPANCELVVTAFPSERNDGALLRLNCVMKEEKGVIQKLIRALAVLKINVLAQESCAIHHQDFHKVSLIIDLSTSPINRKDQVSKETIEFYKNEAANVPLNKDKYIELYESIMAYCGDVFAWSKSRDLPRMTMHPLESDEPAVMHSPTKIMRRSAAQKDKRGVVIKLDKQFINSIKSMLSTNSDKISYVMVSDTEYRKLRIIFPRLQQVDRMLHVGLFHNDVPGALNSILNALSSNNFNIFSSLHRTLTSTESTWEALLEYHGSDAPPNSGSYADVCKWLAKKMVHGLSRSDLMDLEEKGVKVGAPLHPKVAPALRFDAIPLNCSVSKRSRSNNGAQSRPLKYHEEINQVLRQNIARMETENRENPSPLNTMKRILKKRETKIKLFLSYPSTAKAHATIVKEQITLKYPDVFEIDEFQDPNANFITNTVVSKIKDCSGFIGIWHHDIDPESGGISTWMPFEFGLAYMASKEWIVVRSKEVPERIWKRITPNYSMVSYSDLDFKNAIEQILIWCNEKFLS